MGRGWEDLLRACTLMQIIAMAVSVVLRKAMIRGAHVHCGRSSHNATIRRMPVSMLSDPR